MLLGPRGMVIVMVGAVEPKKAADAIGRVLGDWKNRDQVDALLMPELKRLDETVRRHVTIDGKSQADLIIGTMAHAAPMLTIWPLRWAIPSWVNSA